MPKKGKKVAARQARLRKERRKVHHDGSSVATTPVTATETTSAATENLYNKTVIEGPITHAQVTDSHSQTTDQPVEAKHVRNSQTSGSLSHSRRVRSAPDISVYVRKELLRISIISCIVIGVLIALTFVL